MKASTYKPLAPGKSRSGSMNRAIKQGQKPAGEVRLHQKLARSGTVEQPGGQTFKMVK